MGWQNPAGIAGTRHAIGKLPITGSTLIALISRISRLALAGTCYLEHDRCLNRLGSIVRTAPPPCFRNHRDNRCADKSGSRKRLPRAADVPPRFGENNRDKFTEEKRLLTFQSKKNCLPVFSIHLERLDIKVHEEEILICVNLFFNV